MILPLIAGLAVGADVPAFWYRQTVAGAVFPLGAMSETRFQVRTPGHRSEGLVFNSTYYGAGLRLDVSPAFVNPGVQVSLAPIDVFDVDLSAELLGYLPTPFGLLPYDGLTSKLDEVRDARPDHFGALGWALDANPTLKLQLGPIIVLDPALVSWIHIDRPAGETSPYVYEPLRDMIIAWDEVYIDHQPIVLVEFVKGKEGPRFAAGVTYKDRFALTSGDRSAGVGVVICARPFETPAGPTIVLLATESVIDLDRVGKEPFLALQLNWLGEPGLPGTAPPPR